jgi:ammonium transporter
MFCSKQNFHQTERKNETQFISSLVGSSTNQGRAYLFFLRLVIRSACACAVVFPIAFYKRLTNTNENYKMSTTAEEIPLNLVTMDAEMLANMTATIANLQDQLDEMMTSIDAFFVLVMGMICFVLQAGFGLLEVGSIRAKNAQNIMIKNLMDAAVTAIAYYLIGYSMAYGGGGNSFTGGTSLMALRADTITPIDNVYWYFNYVFAGTTSTIVSGAVAERCQFRAYLVYSFALSAFIYPIASHWIWDPSGFMYGKVYDFAGGGAVHMVGGTAAAVGAYILGPRHGKFRVDPTTGKTVPVSIPGHNATLAVVGTLILWFGFFAFNGGSSYAIAGEAAFFATGRAVVVTTLSGASGGLVTMFWGRYATGTWDLSWTINGILAGMVRIYAHLCAATYGQNKTCLFFLTCAHTPFSIILVCLQFARWLFALPPTLLIHGPVRFWEPLEPLCANVRSCFLSTMP